MNEYKTIEKLIADHYNGTPWIEVNLLQTLQEINAETAAKKINNLNTIWQIVYHLICWRETLIKRLNDENVPSPENNFIEPVKDTSAKAWNAILKRLQQSQNEIIKYLRHLKDKPDEIMLQGKFTRYELLQGILQHDVYHLGQIVIINKMIAEKP